MANGVIAMKSNPFLLDTLALSKRLVKAGVPTEQAEVFAEVHKEYFEGIKEALSTKEDLNVVKLSLEKDIKELELRLKKDIKELELRLTMRLGLMITGGIGIIAALIKVF